MTRTKPLCGLGLGGAMLLSHAATQAQTLTGLGFLPGVNYSNAMGISDDGSAAVGLSDHAFRWTRAGGMEDLGLFPGGLVTQAAAASASGDLVTGNGDSSGLFYSAFRWSSAEGLVSVGSLGAASYGWAISADGSVVVGASFLTPSAASQRAFRWTAATGMQNLGELPGQSRSIALGISSDGSVVVGSSGFHAFRWTPAEGMQDLGTLPGGNSASASAVSGDGVVVTGQAVNASGQTVAFRWTSAGGFAPLGVLPHGSGSSGLAISGNGSVVVGRSDDGGFPRAFLWSDATGMVDLGVYLASLGVDLTGWTLTTARGISGDGLTIVGDGVHNGGTEAWIVTLPAGCYANCDNSSAAPVLNVNDFICFQGRFVAGDSYANCDGSTQPPVLNVNDFACFLNRFAAGCP